MQVQINTDDRVEGDVELEARVSSRISETLSRFEARLTRIEVHLGDESAARQGSTDMRCVIEARPSGLKPVSVTHHAATIEEAAAGAAKQMAARLDTEFGKRDTTKGGPSVRHMDTL